MEGTPVQPESKPMNKGLIIGIVVAVVLCCCCLAVGAGAYYFYNMAQTTYSSINEALLTPIVPEFPEIPTIPADSSELPQIPDVPGLDQAIPQGGLGDDILRADTWIYVMAGAAMSNCVASDPSKTQIDVISQPDSAGVWEEKWTVTCDDGSTKAFDVTFVPSSQGGTDISVKESK